MKGTAPLFTIVIATYNCARYLPDAIESVLLQDIGFVESIELVVVDDGSTDETPQVCDAYRAQFPGNITVMRQENAGAAAARLAGLKVARGAYVNFLDADDKWSADACSQAARFFESHPQVGVCAARHLFFGAQEGPHALDYKFDRDAVVRLSAVADFPQVSLSNAFVRRDLLHPEYFDARLRYSEDFLVVNRVLMREGLYGVMSRPVYWYRRRESGGSAINSSWGDPSFYLDTPRFCYQALLRESVGSSGRAARFVQYAVAYDLQWRLRKPGAHPLDEGQLAEYRALMGAILGEIDDEVIAAQRNICTAQKLYMLALKRNIPFGEAQAALGEIGGSLFLDDDDGLVRVCGADEDSGVRVELAHVEGGELVLEGRLATLLPRERVGLAVRVEGAGGKAAWERLADISERPDRAHGSVLDPCYFREAGFRVAMPVDLCARGARIRFSVIADGRAVGARLSYGKLCDFGKKRPGYGLVGPLALIAAGSDSINAMPARCRRVLEREALHQARLLSGGASRASWPARAAAAAGAFGAGGAERVWLLCDRPALAGDNAEALFEHLMAHPVPGVKPVFALDPDSPDHARVSAIGPVVPFGSPRHAEALARASLVVSSSADNVVLGRGGALHDAVRGLGRPGFVFLQHGVTVNNVSSWLNRHAKDIGLLICASAAERRSFLDEPAYGYGERDVVLTGFPRHDRLIAMNSQIPTQRKVLVAPTWRSYLIGAADRKTGYRPSTGALPGSAYHRFWQAFLSDSRLAEAAGDLGYEVEFLIHPAMAAESGAFTSAFATVATSYDYPREMAGSAIMVTDYSSVSFDFALLRKPVLYAQFDRDEFYARHGWSPGYFDYSRDGFGDVCEDLDATVEHLVALMADPVMAAPFRSRADAFFYEPAGTRCEAVADAILEWQAC